MDLHRSLPRAALTVIVLGLLMGLGLALGSCGGEDQAADTGSSPSAVEEQPSPTETSASPSPTQEPSTSPTETMTASPSPTAEPDTPRPTWGFLSKQTYRSWERAPGWQKRKTSDSPHSSGKEVFIDAATADALGSGTDRFPAGATIVKEGYDASGTLEIVAAMQRLPGEGWFFSEYQADGSTIAQGNNIPLCTQCHQGGDDGVLAFPLK